MRHSGFSDYLGTHLAVPSAPKAEVPPLPCLAIALPCRCLALRNPISDPSQGLATARATAIAMAATSRGSLSLLSLNLSSSLASASSHPQSRCSLSMATSRSSHLGGARVLLSVKHRLSTSPSVKTGAPRVLASGTANASLAPAVSPSPSSPGASSQGELIELVNNRDCCWSIA